MIEYTDGGLITRECKVISIGPTGATMISFSDKDGSNHRMTKLEDLILDGQQVPPVTKDLPNKLAEADALTVRLQAELDDALEEVRKLKMQCADAEADMETWRKRSFDKVKKNLQ